MKTSTQILARAAAFLKNHGRSIDRAHYANLFEDGPAGAVLSELEGYQNPDGGFHGLEPDFRTSVSSPMATSVALRYYRELGSRSPALERALDYLRGTFDKTAWRWRPVGVEVNDSPHAPWWEYGKMDSPVNPTAGLAADFLRFAPESWVKELTERLLVHLSTLPAAMECHDLYCYLELYPQLTGEPQRSCGARLKEAGTTLVSREPADWAGYGVKPLWLAPSPTSPLAQPLRELVERNLDFEIANQQEDGSWEPNWSWFGNYAEAWEVARSEWKAILTLKNLKALRAYGRI